VSTRIQAALVAVAIVAAVAVELSVSARLPEAVGDAVAGAALLGAGAVAAVTRRGRGSGALLVAGGVAWFAGTLWPALVFIHRGLLVHLVLAYPRLWPRSLPAAGIIAVGYVCALVTSAARSAEISLALAGGVGLAALVRHGSAAGVERRARATALAGAAAIAVALTVAAFGRLAGGSLDDFSLWAYDTAVALTAIVLAADLRWGRWEHAAVSELVTNLGELERPTALRERLARTLADPELQLGFAAADGFADEAGHPVAVPQPGGRRAASYVQEGGRNVAVLVHDASLLDDRRLLAAALAAARLAAANERMQDEVRAGIAQLEASRRRLVEAAIEQRRSLEEELRTGAEQRLEAVRQRLLAVGGDGALTELVDSVERAREDLRRFAHGIHPAVLTEHGLRAALEESAALMPFDVAVDAPDGRLPASVEVTVYFMCTEALANVAKHAAASRVQIEIRHTDDAVVATVRDDGGGGADLALGSGLRGLADRIAALGGRLDVDSPAGAGTRLRASIPI